MFVVYRRIPANNFSKHLINGMISTIVSKCIPYLQSFGRRLLVHLLTIIFGLISVSLQLIRPGIKSQFFFSNKSAKSDNLGSM